MSNVSLAKRLLIAFVVISLTLVTAVSLSNSSQAHAATSNKPTIEVVNVNTGKATLKQGSTYDLGISVTKGAKVTLKSSKANVVKTVGKKKVKALKPGKSVITISATKKIGKKSYTSKKKVTITVVTKKKYKEVKSLNVLSMFNSMKVGQSTNLKVRFNPAKASNVNLIYKSSNPNVLSVDSKGKMTANASGRALVTITSASKKKVKRTLIINVQGNAPTPPVTDSTNPSTVPLQSISCTVGKMNLTVGETTKITTTFNPSNATNKGLNYTSSNNGVATVDSNGNISAKAVGSAVISVASKENMNIKRSFTIQVAAKPSTNIAVTSIVPSVPKTTLKVGESVQISVAVNPSNATDKRMKFTSGNSQIVSVDSNGNIKGVGKGTADVTITSVSNPGVTSKLSFTVGSNASQNQGNVIDYKNNANVISGADFSYNEDGSITLSDPSLLPANISPGDVLILESTEVGSSGAALKLTDIDRSTGRIKGDQPELEDLFDKLDIRTDAVPDLGSFVPADGIFKEDDGTLAQDDQVFVSDSDATTATVQYPESTVLANRDFYSLDHTQVINYGVSVGAEVTPGSIILGSDGFILKSGNEVIKKYSWDKESLKDKGNEFDNAINGSWSVSYTPSATVALDFDGSIRSFEFKLQGEFKTQIKAGLDIDIYIGSLIMRTPLPTVTLRCDLSFHLGVSGDVSLTLTPVAGVSYDRENGFEQIFDCGKDLKASAKIDGGFVIDADFLVFDFDAKKVDLITSEAEREKYDEMFHGIDCVDPTVNLLLEGKLFARDRDDGTTCCDVQIGFDPSIEIGQRKGILHELGITGHLDFYIEIAKAHLENWKTVDKCTYDIATGFCGTCFWKIGKDGVLDIAPVNGVDSGELDDWTFGSSRTVPPWYDFGSKITSLKITGNVNAKTCRDFLMNCRNVTSADLSTLNTSNATSMQGMFLECNKLETLDLSNFDTSNAENLSGMFYGCNALKTLDLSHFKTPKVTEMYQMFYWCNSLESVNVSGLKEANPTSLESMFESCSKLKSVDLSESSFSNVNNMRRMFYDCASIESIKMPTIITSDEADMSDVFHSCKALVQVDVSCIDTSNAVKMVGMFDHCESLVDLDVSSFNTSNVTNMKAMFSTCLKLKRLNISGLDTSKVKDMSWMFASLIALNDLDVSGLDTSSVEDVQGIFYNCVFKYIDVSHFDTSRVKTMEAMFSGCKNLLNIDIRHFDISNVTTMRNMFSGCVSFESLDLSNLNTSKVNDIYGIFDGCGALKTVNLSGWDTFNVTTMGYMFNNCSSLIDANLSSFDFRNVYNINAMFLWCGALADIHLDAIRVPEGCSTISTFAQCPLKNTVPIINGEA